MSCRFLRCLLPVSALALTACHKQVQRPAIEPVAILRFENLGSDPSDDWMGRAFSEIISSELAGAPGLYDLSAGRLHNVQASLGSRSVTAPGVSAERTAAAVSGAARIGYGQYFVRHGVLQAQLTIEDTLTGQVTTIGPLSMPAADLVAEASALALRISPRITPYGTRNPLVVQAHVDAMEHGETPQMAEELQKAIAADPNFGPSYQQLAQYKVQQKDVEGALALLNDALARGNTVGNAERARIQLQSAILRNDIPGRLEALTALAQADPSDPQTWRDMGVLAMATHQYPRAVDAYRKLLALQPADADGWNTLGYAAAYAGDVTTALDAIKNYQKLAGNSPNPLDSLGDVNLIVGRLGDAESAYRQNAKTNPAFFNGLDFFKAAMAHLMTGDIPGADAMAQPYFDARTAARDPIVDYRKAQWLWLAGRRKAACQEMEKTADAAASTSRDAASRDYSELALWTLMLGNREPAAQFAQKAAALATPASATQAALVRFMTQPVASPAEWEARAAQLAPSPAQSAIRDVALAYALLFAKEYTAAAPILQRIYDSGNQGAGEGLPVVLAWADVETGRIDQAATMLRPNYPLSDGGMNWTTPLHFPRIYYLRSVVAQKQGKADETQSNLRLFERLSGPDALMWGEEHR